MADEIIRMEDIYADDIVGNINEVREARGTFESLDARLDNIDGNAPSPSTSDPAMDGTASPGSADTYSRGDHVHPTDTSRQAVIDSSHKLSSDLVDDTNNTNKFATAAQLQQITTNETNISSILDGTTIDSFGDVETALSGKQATLTTAQLAAVNSGIDSTKVAQIETNKNNILTDEAALVELVDGGAKNLLKLGFSKKIAINQTAEMTADGNGVVINGSRNSVTDTILVYDIVTNLNDGLDTRYTLPAGEYIMTKTGDANVRLQAYAHDGTNSIALGYTQVSDLHFKYTNEMKSQYPYLTFRIWVSRVSNFDNFTFYPMICTKTAWDISQAYQPYRPSYQELYEMVKALQANQ